MHLVFQEKDVGEIREAVGIAPRSLSGLEWTAQILVVEIGMAGR